MKIQNARDVEFFQTLWTVPDIISVGKILPEGWNMSGIHVHWILTSTSSRNVVPRIQSSVPVPIKKPISNVPFLDSMLIHTATANTTFVLQ